MNGTAEKKYVAGDWVETEPGVFRLEVAGVIEARLSDMGMDQPRVEKALEAETKGLLLDMKRLLNAEREMLSVYIWGRGGV